jgi:hypothetical protein
MNTRMNDDDLIRRGDVLAAVLASAPNADAYAYSAIAALPAVTPQPAPDVGALVEAAKAVVDRWDGPTWGGNISNITHTADVINRLRAALAAWDGRGNE